MPETAAPEIKVLRQPKEQKASDNSGVNPGGKPAGYRGSRSAAAARASPPTTDLGGVALIYRPGVSASGDMASVKLVGVQDKEERKKGAPGYWGAGSGQRAAFAAARGGWGSGGGFLSTFMAQAGRNLGGLALMASVGVAAAAFGIFKSSEYQSYREATKQGFAKKDRAGIRASVSAASPSDRPMGGNSLSMVTGSLDGKTQAQRDKEAADAAARAKAAADAKAKEEADAKAQADAAAKAADPNAALQAAMAGQAQQQAPEQAKGLAHGSIGSLSTALGGSGGPALNGGAGMSGGITGSFGNAKFDANKLLAMKTAPQAAKTSGPAAAAYRGVGRGKALRQLDKVAHFSNLALNGANESRSSNASAPFDNSVPGGERLTGAGAQSGTSPKDSQPDASPAPNTPGQGEGQALTTPADDGLTDCGNGVRAPAGQCPQTQTGHSVDPTDSVVSMLKILMGITAALAAIQLFYSMMKNKPTYDSIIWAGLWYSMANIIGALGIAICALGVTLMTMGRPIMGGIAAAIGALTAVTAWTGNAGFSQGTKLLAVAAMNGVAMFLNNPDHKEADPNNPGQLRDGGGGWF